jgi:putative 2OG-Fe(II) oxygenase
VESINLKMNNKSENINKLLNDGFLTVDNNILDKEEIKDLSLKCHDAIINCESVNYKEYKDNYFVNENFKKFNNQQVVDDFFKQKIRHILGVSDEVDQYVGKIISHDSIKEILNYLFLEPKCHGVHIRMADKNSIPLGIHTDASNELSLSILLNDVTNKDATTVVIRSSHLFPTSIKNTIERLSPRFFSFFTTAITGKIGSLNFFFNKAAHGVKKGKGNKSIAILIGFHDNQHKEHKIVLLPEKTIKNFSLINNKDFPMNYFETNPENSRNITMKDVRISKIHEHRKMSIREKIIYFILILSGYFVKFLKKIKSLI